MTKVRKGHETVINAHVGCNICKNGAAMYDGKTSLGPWAFMCQLCWQQYGPGQTGVGLGQRLIVEVPDHDAEVPDHDAEVPDHDAEVPDHDAESLTMMHEDAVTECMLRISRGERCMVCSAEWRYERQGDGKGSYIMDHAVDCEYVNASDRID